MFALGFALISLQTGAQAAPVDDCVEASKAWIARLPAAECPPLFRYEAAAVEACRSMPSDGWSRDAKSARRAFLRDCAPTIEGYPGAHATQASGRILSHCGELILMMRGIDATSKLPSKPTMGIDGMAAAVGAALFACSTPDEIAACRMPFSLHTATDRLNAQLKACESVKGPKLDAVMETLADGSGLLPVDAEQQASEIRAVLTEKARLEALKAQQLADFQEARAAEPERASALSDTCMAIPGEMNHPDQADAAIAACGELLALWRGEDTVRRALESDGKLAEHYQAQLKGKVLNAASLHVADEARVKARPTTLAARKVDLIAMHFEELLATDVAAAEAWVDRYRDLMSPDWVADALDRVLAATM